MDEPAGEKRIALLKESRQALSQARTLNPTDWEIVYTLGLARLSSGDFPAAASAFAQVYQRGGELAPTALEHLQTIYKTAHANSKGDFESFVQQAAHSDTTDLQQSPSEKSTVARQMPAYARLRFLPSLPRRHLPELVSFRHVQDAAPLCARKCDRRFRAEQ